MNNIIKSQNLAVSKTPVEIEGLFKPPLPIPQYTVILLKNPRSMYNLLRPLHFKWKLY
jgi:hypothetical protein